MTSPHNPPEPSNDTGHPAIPEENPDATIDPTPRQPETPQETDSDSLNETVVLLGDELTPSIDPEQPDVTYLSIISHDGEVGPVQMDIALGVDSLVDLRDMLTKRIAELGDDDDGTDGKRSRFQRITDPANIGHIQFDMNRPLIGPVTPVHILAGLIILAVFVGILGSI